MAYHWLLPRCLLAATLTLSLGAGGCAPTTQGTQLSQLPPYTPDAARLFDDTFSEGVFGLPERTDPDTRRRFAARVREADVIGVAKVQTVSSEGGGEFVRYTLICSWQSAKKGHPEGTVELQVVPTNPSFAAISGHDARLMGQQVVLFIKLFNESGEGTFHFHAATHNAQTLERIQRELALIELATSN